MFKIHNKLTKITKKSKKFIDFYVKKVYYVYCIGIFTNNFYKISINCILADRRVLLWQTDCFRQLFIR